MGKRRLDGIEYYISRAEIAWKSGYSRDALHEAKRALLISQKDTGVSDNVCTALRIFVARCHAKLGELTKSNEVYRALIREEIHLPPVIMGLLHNSLRASDEKAGRNLGLIKIFVGEK